MKVFEIIDKLCAHEISKSEAKTMLSEITDGLRRLDSIEFYVESIGYTLEDNHGILKLKLPYSYSKIENRIKKGDKVDVIILP